MTKKLLIAGLLPLFFACNSEDDNFSADVDNVGKVSVTCSINNGDTRTTLDETTYQSTWNTGDAIGVMYANKGPISFATIQGNQTRSVFTTSADTTGAGEAVCAYYPFGKGDVVGKNITYTLDAAQVKTEKYTNFAEYDHMVAIASPTAANMNFPFERTLSLIVFKTNINLFPEGINVGKVTVTENNEEGSYLAGTYTLDMTKLPTAQTYTVKDGKREMTTTLVTEPSANNCLAYACVLPGKDRELTMMIEGAGDAAGIKMKINYAGGKTFEAGKYYEYMVTTDEAQYVWFNFGALINKNTINGLKKAEALTGTPYIKDYDYDGKGATTGTVGKDTWVRLTNEGLQAAKTTIKGMLQ